MASNPISVSAIARRRVTATPGRPCLPYTCLPYRWVLLLVSGTMGLASCSSMHVKRATYQMLRQGDCQLNAFDEFCNRNYVAEYHAYERLRNDFLHESDQERRRRPPMAASAAK